MRIRRAEEKDLGAVNRLLEQVLSVHHGGRPDLFNSEGKKYSDGELLEIFADNVRPVFVYEEGGEVLGYAFCEIHHQGSGSLKPLKSLYVDDLCVDEKARGRGIGKALFGYVRSFAMQEGCHNITLHVWECNPSARTFYDSLGLKPQYTSMETVLDSGSVGE